MIKKTIQTISIFLSSLFIVFFLTACQTDKYADIVTTLYPQYDIARNIAGDKLTVSLLTPFGSEVHDYAPTAKDIISIKEAKLFLYTSADMERWVLGILDDTVNAIDVSKTFVSQTYIHGTDASDDLHYWTDPTNILQIILHIRDELMTIDPENSAYYYDNAQSYYNDIKNTHDDIENFLQDFDETPRLFFYGHNALAAFGARYGLEVISLSDNYQPDAELTPRQIELLKERMKEAKASFLFVEELIDLRSVYALKDELASEGYPVTILELHGFHNISYTQNQEDISYAYLLRQNLTNLKTALLA